MEDSAREIVNNFLAQYDTLAIATEHEGQPFVTRVFFVEEPMSDRELKLYGTFITTSRKLTNLKQNPRVGIFIGPSQPSSWLEATALARILTDESKSSVVLENLGKKSPVAAAFIARVPIVAIEIQIKWLRITNLADSPLYTEMTFDTVTSE
jgi:nitroimidazol reductase NimA-like FMN-containing flavoprotein (pyridoxamine 5'-phosphate oxidase superfamily)